MENVVSEKSPFTTFIIASLTLHQNWRLVHNFYWIKNEFCNVDKHYTVFVYAMQLLETKQLCIFVVGERKIKLV